MQIQQQMMQQQQIQQQMMQQQMMQQQMMAAAQMQNILNDPINPGISVVFRPSGSPNNFLKMAPTRVLCDPDEKVSSIIEKYRMQSGDYDPDKKFIFNAKNLAPSLTFAEVGLSNNANIFVVSTRGIKANK